MNEVLKASIIEYLRDKGHASVTQIAHGIDKVDYLSEVVNVMNALCTLGEVTAEYGTGRGKSKIYSLAPAPVTAPEPEIAPTITMLQIDQVSADDADLLQKKLDELPLLQARVDAWEAIAKQHGAVSPYGLGKVIDGLKTQISDKSAVVAPVVHQPRQPLTVTNIRGSCVDGQGCVTLFFDRMVHARSIKLDVEILGDVIDVSQ